MNKLVWLTDAQMERLRPFSPQSHCKFQGAPHCLEPAGAKRGPDDTGGRRAG